MSKYLSDGLLVHKIRTSEPKRAETVRSEVVTERIVLSAIRVAIFFQRSFNTLRSHRLPNLRIRGGAGVAAEFSCGFVEPFCACFLAMCGGGGGIAWWRSDKV